MITLTSLKKQEQFILVATLVFILSLLTTACLGQDNAVTGAENSENEAETETAISKQILQEEANGSDEELNMEADYSEENNNSPDPAEVDQAETEPAPSPPIKDPEQLFLSLEQVATKDYLDQYGQNSLSDDPVSAAAVNIASVTFNKKLFEENYLKTGERLLLELTDHINEVVSLESVTYGSSSISLRGKISGKPGSSLVLSTTGNETLMTLRLPEQNRLYMVKYNQQGGKHYLFEAPLDAIEQKPEEPLPERTLAE